MQTLNVGTEKMQIKEEVRSKTIVDSIWLFVFIIVCQGVGALGALFTASSVKTWYITLTKPPLTPPAWIFAPVWITLYLLMAISIWLVWRQRKNKNIKLAATLFAVQLTLNFFWSPAFFGFQQLLVALILIIALELTIIIYIVKVYPVSKAAAVLMMPYPIWVGFATYLNAGILFLN